jgi:DNA-binding XRE family transcriptional regulator
MKDIIIHKTKKSGKFIRANSISFTKLYKDLTPDQRIEVEKRKRYYQIMMLMRKSRMERGLTQTSLAKLVNLPRTMITKIESGERNVTIETLMNIAQVMGKELVVDFK